MEERARGIYRMGTKNGHDRQNKEIGGDDLWARKEGENEGMSVKA